MLISYKYIKTPFTNMQKFVDYIFKVWYLAKPEKSFEDTLYCEANDFKNFILTRQTRERRESYLKFRSLLSDIFERFATLTPEQRQRMLEGYIANNSIKRICCGTIGIKPLRYDEIKKIDKKLTFLLHTFFDAIYTKYKSNNRFVRKFKQFSYHHDALMEQQENMDKCPFCGLEELKSHRDTKKNAMDHFLPISLYPFNAVNCRNIAPACHECNSVRKHTKDPIFNKQIKRRKAFYPYAKSKPDISIAVIIKSRLSPKMNPDDFEFIFRPDSHEEEVCTWRDLYDIDERYREKCSKKSFDWCCAAEKIMYRYKCSVEQALGYFDIEADCTRNRDAAYMLRQGFCANNSVIDLLRIKERLDNGEDLLS